MLKILNTFFTKQAPLMRRSTVLSLPPQLVFPAQVVSKFAILVLNLDQYIIDFKGFYGPYNKLGFKG
jgi:hypothetical protein